MAVTCNCLGQASVSTTVAQVAADKSKIFNVQPQNFAVSWTYKKGLGCVSPLRNIFGLNNHKDTYINQIGHVMLAIWQLALTTNVYND